MSAEFGRQVETLLDRGYPKAAGLTAEHFVRHLEPLRKSAAELPAFDEPRAEGAFRS